MRAKLVVCCPISYKAGLAPPPPGTHVQLYSLKYELEPGLKLLTLAILILSILVPWGLHLPTFSCH